MSAINTSAILTKPRSASGTLIENNDNDSQVRVTLLEQVPLKPRHHQYNNNNKSSPSLIPNRTPSNLLELKQQRLLAAADRKKRIITRIISIVGLFIILLCAIIVTLTLKMAPQIDELVRTKTGTHQLIHLRSRMTTPLITTVALNNFTTNSSLITRSIFRTRRKLFI